MVLSKAQRTRKTTALPSALLEKIKEDGSHSASRSQKKQLSRKGPAKTDRVDKKQRKAHQTTVSSSSRNTTLKKRKYESSPDQLPPRKKVKLEQSPKPNTMKPLEPTPLEKLVRLSKPSRSVPEDQDDTYIRYLEEKLGYTTKGRGNGDDGLDDLLDFADTIGKATDILEDASHSEKDNDLEEEPSTSETSEEWEDEEEWRGISQESSALRHEQTSNEGSGSSTESGSPKGTKYVPPHLRSKQDEVDIKLSRQLKGLLNRLSEQNMTVILDGVEEAYRQHRRADVTSALSSLIIDGLASHALLLDSYVVLHAALVSSLHKIIGPEFAAYFVQSTVSSYEKFLAQAKIAYHNDLSEGDQVPGGKESSNLIGLLSELYNFQVIGCNLVFDLIWSLLPEELGELEVELLLKLVRNSGTQLRQDDSSALKDIVQQVQTKLSGKEGNISSRTRFMLETLTNLKNNKVKQRPAATHQGGDAVERMKKFLTNLGKRKHVLAHEPLRVSLTDLRSADTKGKWWLVGAAWSGDPLVDRKHDVKTVDPTQTQPSESMLMKLAKKHGMNTDIRRSIFVVVMSSEDYIDASDRLSQLKLTEVQQREIVRVLLHCCGNEKTYNPYYALIASHLCTLSHSYKITLQFTLWDFMRDIGETSVGGSQVIKSQDAVDTFSVGNGDGKVSKTRMSNVARSYAWLVAKGSLTLVILKPIDFTLLKSTTQRFLHELFLWLFIYTQSLSPTATLASIPRKRHSSTLEEVFLKAAKIEALAMGLVYFLGQLHRDREEDTQEDFVEWAVKVARDALRAGIDVL
ncbi:hypothetical protein DL96DRAFT_1708486 [Flagelloscypha sp. PMI_526]|nr:hypothetical protein DL96DRAFT_1708486 [Flagelloscypha sp. PMI_526]